MNAGSGTGLVLGFDAGSVAFKLVVADLAGNLVERSYTRTHGRPVETALAQLQQALDRHGRSAFALVAGTGSAGRLICQLLDVPFVNEVICQATAVRRLVPQVRTIIEMGGQDSKLIFLSDAGTNGSAMVDFAMNSNCAAGTGSFLDQQASRLGIAIEEEFGRLALQSVSPPRVAGRCSVFAKSDMIHLQQQAAPVHDIVAGLCLGLARNLKSNLARGMALPRPIAFCGGVAANAGVVRALEHVFELQQGELIVHEAHAVTGALGAAIVALAEQRRRGVEQGPKALDVSPLREYLHNARSIGHRIDPLTAPSDGQPDGSLPSRELLESLAKGKPIDAWLGLDVGSISTKVAVIDADNRVLAKIYLMTAGRPLEASRKALREIGRQVGGLVNIRGAATTGSGRYLTGDFIGADMVINEITAQATAAAAIDPEVDTIFEIGGQDSKYISLDGGVVVDFEMNHACAAGTGSFLEEQAERLGISIKGQFSQLALSSAGPIRLGERCTVFMESDLLSYQQQGARTDDLVAGLCYSIVSNYINRVVGHRRIGQRIFFQGGTAFNLGVVSAFERVTGRRITVPPHHEVTGAIGAAILARRYQEQHKREKSNFGGFELADLDYSIRSFECDGCANNCEINEVTVPGREALYYGSRCDRYNKKKDKATTADIPNLFAERHRLLLQHAGLSANAKSAIRNPQPKMGIPLALSNYQLLPFWGTLLSQLGFEVVVSPISNPQIIQSGVETVMSTPCFPVKVAHGHVLELIRRGVDWIWVPSIIALKREYAENEYNQLCPYVTAIPYQVTAALEPRGISARLIKVPVRFTDPGELYKSLKPVCAELGVRPRRLRKAIATAWEAQDRFDEACRQRGRQVLEKLAPRQPAVVIVSRPYNGCDSGVSLDLPNKLRRMGVLPIPMDFLDLGDSGQSDDRVVRGMYWKYGQRILRAARLIRDDPRLHAIYLSNFSCGPDSFLISYFKRIMAPKPSLVLEIDEHSADAGVVTRLEAFLESLANAPPPESLPPARALYPLHQANGHVRKLFVPWMGDVSHAMAAAFRAYGQPAEVIPVADDKSIELGRRVCSGKECLPCIITAGDMLRVAGREDFDADRSAFFMPGGSGPCRFGQYNCMHKLLLNDMGLGNVPVVAVSQDKSFYEEWKQFTGDPSRLGWCGICAVDVLHKALLAVRPYEKNRGETDAVYQRCLDRACRLIEQRCSDEDLAGLLEQCASDFAAIPADRSVRRPLIGVVGEIYVRHHSFANGDLLRQLESLGAETTLASFPEWIYYTNWTRMVESGHSRSFRQWLGNFLADRVQRRIQTRINASFVPLLGKIDEPRTQELLELADPYVHRSFGAGETVLSVGKMIELQRHGCHGVINVMPFSCMPSTVVGSLMKKLADALGDMPTISISYDGQQDPMLQTRLEAFIYQARVYQSRRSAAISTSRARERAVGGGLPLPHGRGS